MTDIRFHTNDYVRVKLTKSGMKYYTEFFGRPPKLESDGTYRDQCWHLFSDFNNLFVWGGEQPFESTIILEPED